jgi:hypothetical protein
LYGRGFTAVYCTNGNVDMDLPSAEGELCMKEEAILTREGEAVKLSSPAAVDTTTCTILEGAETAPGELEPDSGVWKD